MTNLIAPSEETWRRLLAAAPIEHVRFHELRSRHDAERPHLPHELWCSAFVGSIAYEDIADAIHALACLEKRLAIHVEDDRELPGFEVFAGKTEILPADVTNLLVDTDTIQRGINETLARAGDPPYPRWPEQPLLEAWILLDDWNDRRIFGRTAIGWTRFDWGTSA